MAGTHVSPGSTVHPVTGYGRSDGVGVGVFERTKFPELTSNSLLSRFRDWSLWSALYPKIALLGFFTRLEEPEVPIQSLLSRVTWQSVPRHTLHSVYTLKFKRKFFRSSLSVVSKIIKNKLDHIDFIIVNTCISYTFDNSFTKCKKNTWEVVELSLDGIKSTGHRCTPNTDGITCGRDLRYVSRGMSHPDLSTFLRQTRVL